MKAADFHGNGGTSVFLKSVVRGYFRLKNLDPSDHVNPNLNREKLRKKQTYRRNYIPENDHEQNNDEQNDDEQNDDEQNGEDENLSNNNSNVSDRTIHVEPERNLFNDKWRQ